MSENPTKSRSPLSTTSFNKYQILTTSEVEDPEWDAFISRRPEGNIVQTSLWGLVKQQRKGQVVRITILDRGQIVAGVQVLIRSFPFIGSIGYAPKGPIYARNEPQLTRLMIEQMRRVAQTNRLHYLVVQPQRVNAGTEMYLQQGGFQPSLIDVGPTASVQVDLTPDLDRVFAGLKKSTRRYIRRGLREGLIGREGSIDDIPTFYRLLECSGRRVGYALYPESYFFEMWRCLHADGYLKLFLVEYEGEVICAQIVVAFGDTVTAKMSGWSGQHTSLRPILMLDWTTIQWAKSQGYTCYDLEGIDRNIAKRVLEKNIMPDPKTEGAAHYKTSFGGRVVLFSEAYAYLPNPALRWLHSIIAPPMKDWSFIERLLGNLRTT